MKKNNLLWWVGGLGLLASSLSKAEKKEEEKSFVPSIEWNPYTVLPEDKKQEIRKEIERLKASKEPKIEGIELSSKKLRSNEFWNKFSTDKASTRKLYQFMNIPLEDLFKKEGNQSDYVTRITGSLINCLNSAMKCESNSIDGIALQIDVWYKKDEDDHGMFGEIPDSIYLTTREFISPQFGYKENRQYVPVVTSNKNEKYDFGDLLSLFYESSYREAKKKAFDFEDSGDTTSRSFPYYSEFIDLLNLEMLVNPPSFK